MIAEFAGKKPNVHATAYIHESADVIGDVTLGANVSIWFQTVVRGDVHWIKIGEFTNIQDTSILHVTSGKCPLSIGARVTVGHGALLHGCTIKDDCLIGMGSIILDGAVINEGSIVAAGALVSPGKEYPANSLIIGSPAKAIRQVSSAERAGMIDQGWKNYHGYIQEYRKSFKILQK